MRIFTILMLSVSVASSQSFNGFDVSNVTIPLSEIRSGGPPRDGIPSIDHPVFILPAAADYMLDTDEVVSVTVGKETRAYPLRIIVWHEIVNDEVAGRSMAITYCPLCGTAIVFNREIGARTLSFGVSGMLYQSDVLMYDRQTESLWSQLAMSAVSGPLVKTKLEWLPSEQLTWAAWKAKYPKGKVLSTNTGFRRDYSGTAYARYKRSSTPLFPVPSHRTELPPKEWVIGVLVDGKARAYPIRSLVGNHIVQDGELQITYDATSHLVEIKSREGGKTFPSVKVYWFAWQAFYPDTSLWIDEEDQ